MRKYLFEKHYKDELKTTRLLFNTSQELFEFLLLEGEKAFNAGGNSAEIRLHRIKLKE